MRLAAGERRRLLAHMHVVETDPGERLHLLADGRYRLEEVARLLDRHVEHVGNGSVAVLHLERLAVVALALARRG